jgi:hypothetical protein
MIIMPPEVDADHADRVGRELAAAIASGAATAIAERS